MLDNPTGTKDAVVSWIRTYFNENGPDCSAVVGISGGKDSSVVAALCVEALGKDRVIGVLMPNGIQSDLAYSYLLVEHLGIDYKYINIGSVMNEAVNAIGDNLSNQAYINLPPRLRMAMLYAVAQSLPNGGRVANTCNRSEDFVGYSTKFGDTAGDFSPLSYLMVHEVIQLGHALGLPAELVEKPPSDGLCGKTDEENLGVTYAEIDQYIATGYCDSADSENRIAELNRRNLHKLQPMPCYIHIPGLTP